MEKRIYILLATFVAFYFLLKYKLNQHMNYDNEPLIFSDLIKENKEAFLAKVRVLAKKMNINPNWLMAIMWKESKMNHRIVNSIGAVGLIQFVPTTAGDLGTTTTQLKNMSNVDQLDYVYKYFTKYYKKTYTSYTHLYLYCFHPVAVGKPDSFIVASYPSKTYMTNKVVDANKDGKITVADFGKYALQEIPTRYLPYL